MRYLVRARVRPGRQEALPTAIESGQLGAGSVAEGEYLRNMSHARALKDGTVTWKPGPGTRGVPFRAIPDGTPTAR